MKYLRLLDCFALTCDGRSIPVPGSAQRLLAYLALHPHPLPPDLEHLSPRFYNRLALAWQRSLERSPLGLAYSSAFVAIFERED